MLRLPGLRGGPARAWRGALHRRHRHPDPDGRRLPRARTALQVLRRGHAAAGRSGAGYRRAPRHLRGRVQREVLRGPRLPRPRELLGQLQPRARPLRGGRAAGLDGGELLLQHQLRRRQPALPGRALVAPGGLRPAPGPHRSRLRVLGLSRRHRRRERLEPDRHPRADLPGEEHLQQGHCIQNEYRCRAPTDPRDGFSRTHFRAHPQLRRVPRLLAAESLQQPRRGPGVLGLPGTGGDDGPLGAAQVRGPRPRRGSAPAGHLHPQRATHRDRTGLLRRALLRERRDDRRRDRLPPRRRQLPLSGRGRLLRHLAARAGEAPGAAGVGEVVDGPAPQRLGARAGEPPHPLSGGVDTPGATFHRGARLVPILHRADRRLRRSAPRRLPHRLHRRARLRSVVPPERCARAVGRGLGGGRTPRALSHGTRRPGHAAHRGGPHLRRLRVQRPDRSLRGRNRLCGRPQVEQRELRRPGRAGAAQGRAPAQARRPGAFGRGSRCARGLRARGARPDRRGHEWHALAAARQVHRAGPPGGASTPSPAPKSRWARSTATRSGSRPGSCPSPSTIRRKRGSGPEPWGGRTFPTDTNASSD